MIKAMFLAAAASLALAGAADAATMTQTKNVSANGAASAGSPYGLTFSSGPIAFDAFDPTQGTLTGVRIEHDIDVFVGFSQTYQASVPVTFTYDIFTFQGLSFERPGFNPAADIFREFNTSKVEEIGPTFGSLGLSATVRNAGTTEYNANNDAYFVPLFVATAGQTSVRLKEFGSGSLNIRSTTPGINALTQPRGWSAIRTGTVSLTYIFEPAATAPVPEPATWALMIGGFGLAGGAMRTRRRVALA